MIYIPKKMQMINAIPFESIQKNGEEVSKFGIKPIPPNVQIRCGCGRPVYEHGLMNGNNIVCPGTYIIYEGHTFTSAMSKSNFEAIYKPLIDEKDIVDAEEKS